MRIIKCELDRTICEIKSYYPDYIVSFILDIFILFIVMKNGENKNISFWAYVSWTLASRVLTEASLNISTEKQLGTLQNIMIKQYSILEIIMSKSIIWFIIDLVKTLMVALLINFFVFNLNLDIRLIIILLLEFLGILGLSLIMSSLTLVYTKVASFETILSIILLYLSGSIFDVPKGFTYTNPISYGTYLITEIYSGTANITDFLIALTISLIWFVIGCFGFKLIFSKSKEFKWNY